MKKRGRPGNTYHVNDSGGREVDIGGALPINQLVCNSEFLTSEVETVDLVKLRSPGNL